MKKRLLSAALALAMVLTMLPLTVFAADPPSTSASDTPTGTAITAGDANVNVGKYTFKWYEKDAQLPDPDKTPAGAAGYYYYGAVASDQDAEKKIYYANSGVINGTGGTSGVWYDSPIKTTANNGTAAVWNTTSFTLAGTLSSIDVDKSLSINLHGQGATLALTTDPTTVGNVTGLTITNTAAKADPDAARPEGTVTLSSGWTVGKSFTLSVTNAEVSGTLTVDGVKSTTDPSKYTTTANLTATTLNNAVVDDLTVKNGTMTVTATNGSELGDLTCENGKATINVTSSSHGDITLGVTQGTNDYSKTGGTINLTGANVSATNDVPAINIKGSATVTIKDMSKVGGIEVIGGLYDEGTKKTSGGKVTVNVSGQSTTGAISTGTDNAQVVEVTNSATVESITLSNANTAHKITVDGGTVPAGSGSSGSAVITLTAGTLTIKNNATVGAVALGTTTAGGKLTADISGAGTTVASLTVTGTKVDPTVNITGGTFTGAVNLGTAYSKKTISGGTFSESIANQTGWLKGVTYEIGTKKDSQSTDFDQFTYTDSFQACVDATKNAPKDSSGDPDIQIKAVGMGSGATALYAAFKMGVGNDAKEVVRIITDATTAITLPASVNGSAVDVWYLGTNNERKTPGTQVLVPTGSTADAPYLITTAVGAADNNQIVEVTADYSTGKNSSNPGLSATLSGTTIKVSGAVRSNASPSEPIDLLVKTANEVEHHITVFFLLNSDGRTGKLNPGGGLSDPFYANDTNTAIKVKGLDGVEYLLDGSGLVVKTAAAEMGSAAGSTEAVSSVSGLGTAQKAALEEKLKGITASTIVNDPAIQEAANKILAGLTETQVNTHIKNAKIKLWQKANNSTKTPDDQALEDYSDYNKLNVVVYLHVVAKTWNQQAGAQSMQLDIEPWYRLEVVSGTNGRDPYVIQTGRALSMSGVTAEYGDISVSLASALPTGFAPSWAHHKDTYAYKIENDAFTTSNGFSPFLLNGVNPKATLTPAGQNPTAVYYDNVQTAIDEVEEGGTITLQPNYGKTSETFSVTGKARTFEFDIGSNGTFVPTFTGANVTVDTTGSVRTVQLSADNITVAKITVNTATNGTAALTTPSTANRGSTVTGTLSPSKGYKVGTVTAKSNTGANVSVSVDTTKNTFSFVVPSDATSVTVTPTFVVDDGMNFVDVNENDWFYDGVYYCFTHNAGGQPIMEGTDATHFYPGSTLVRGDFVKVLWRLAGAPVETPTVTYSDVPSSYHAYNAIVWATNHGIAKGYGDGTFKPTVGVSRQEMVTFLWRAAESPKVSLDLASRFTDGGGVASWAREAMQWAAGLNILCGVSSVNVGSTLYPWAQAQRAQIAVTAATYHDMYIS